jgi:hypothetical protein
MDWIQIVSLLVNDASEVSLFLLFCILYFHTAEAFLGKGFYRKRVSYHHAKGKCGIKERPECRLIIVVREMTAEECSR